jgi:glutathione S-transferase
VARAHTLRGSRWADDPAAIAEMKRKAPQAFADCFELIEHDLIAGPWVMGKTYSMCDPYLFTMSLWLESDGNLGRFPRVQEHRQRMAERLAVKKALAVVGG